jgi:hypothetical protein
MTGPGGKQPGYVALRGARGDVQAAGVAVGLAGRIIWRDPLVDIGAAAGRDEPSDPAARGQELVQDHLANVEFRPVHRADAPPPGMCPDQNLWTRSSPRV